MHICFFDQNPYWEDTLNRLLNKVIKRVICDDYSFFTGKLTLDTIHNSQHQKPFYFVSPANSYGHMDGGLDLVYSTMDPLVQNKVYQVIKNLPNKHLPVGNAFIVAYLEQHYLICCPTMAYAGQNVSQSRNAYLAMMAILQTTNKLNGTLFIPGLCTMVGKMSYEQSAQQVVDAIIDFEKQLIK